MYNRSMYEMGLSEDLDAPVNVSYAKFLTSILFPYPMNSTRKNI